MYYEHCEDADISLKNQFLPAEKPRFLQFQQLNERKSYIAVAGCIYDHIVKNKKLSNQEKLYYLLADGLCIISNNEGRQRAIALSSRKWSNLLGCSRPQVFAMQESLEQKGYFIVSKTKNKCCQNNRNLIATTLPDAVFEDLRSLPNNTYGNKEKLFNPLTDSKRAYIDITKQFIRINYTMLKMVISCNKLTDFQKVMWLSFYLKSYNSSASIGFLGNFSFTVSYSEMMAQYSCGNKCISQNITQLENSGFIHRKRLYIKSGEDIQARQDKSLWLITLALPSNYGQELMLLKDRANLKLTPEFAQNVKEAMNINQETKKGNTVIPDIVWEEDTINKRATEEAKILKKTIAEAKNNLNQYHNTEQCNPSSISHICDISLSPDPDCSFGLPSTYINKYFKIQKSIRSNLGNKSNFFYFNKKNDNTAEFNIQTILIKQKIKQLPKDKADKARKFAYALSSRKLAKGYAADISKHELAKQLIFHAASWKPENYSHLPEKDQIDIALASAWKTITNGSWKAPLEWIKAENLQYEFEYYKQKYRETGVLSCFEIADLEKAVSSLLKESYNSILTHEITTGKNTENSETLTSDSYGCFNHNIQSAAETGKNNKTRALSQTTNADEPIISDNYFIHENYISKYNDGADDIVHSMDLSLISEEQKQVTYTPSDIDDTTVLKTTDNKQYSFKIKSIHTNSFGDMVVILQPASGSVLSGTNNYTDNVQDSSKTVDMAGINWQIEATPGCLLADKKLTGSDMDEHLQRVKIHDAHNATGSSYIDYAKLLDED